MTRRAKTLDPLQTEALIRVARSISSVPESAELRVMLSYFAGLRAAEIANLPVSAMTGVDGRPARVIEIPRSVGKLRRARTIPMHGRIREALERFLLLYPNANYIALSRRTSRKAPRKMTPNAVTVWFHRLYKIAGMSGCSSHSGRRTFATMLARTTGSFGNSLVDVQRLLGHKQLTTTQAYVQVSENVVDLVHSIGMPAEDVYHGSYSARRPVSRRAKWESVQ